MNFVGKLALTVVCAFGFAHCGGGGGGDGEGEFVGAARVDLTISPQRIDTGDRTEVRIRLSDIHENGIALKVRYPKGLDYVRGSSFIEVENSDQDVDPTVNQGVESEIFLVYYIAPDSLGRQKQGTLFFELEGRDSVDDGIIEVDADVDDPDINNSTEFDIERPEFQGEQESSIEVTE
jgi:hypothetical protein